MKPHTSETVLKNIPNKPGQPQSLLLDYYQPAFAWLHTQLPSSLSRVHEIRKTFWKLVPEGRYDQLSAQELIKSYAFVVESRLADEIKKHSIAYWIHVYRRLSPHSIGANQAEATAMLVRQILEASFQKYGSTEDCDGIGWSDRLKPEEVLSGVPEPFKGTYLIERYLTNTRQHLLKDFGLNELIGFYQCEKLAYELWRCGATLRIISKGASLLVDHANNNEFLDDRTEELNELVASYDERGDSFIASATATVFRSSNDIFRADGVVFLAQYNVAHTKASGYEYLFKQIRFPKDLEFNFDLLPFQVDDFCRSHAAFSSPFYKKHGVHYEVILMVIMSLFSKILERWTIDEANLFQWFQRAYTGPSSIEDIKAAVMSGIERSAEKLGAAIPSNEEVKKAISFLTLTDQKRSGISLLTGGPKYLFVPSSRGRFLVDFAWLISSLHYLFLGVPFPPDSLKGKVLETFVGGSKSVLPDGECKGLDGQSREVDAAFERGKFLIIVECKANARSIAYDRGDLNALIFRRNKFEDALEQVDDKAKWLSLHGKGTNYDIRQYEGILPVVVTPFKEFMPSLSSRYWIEKKRPRVLLPTELERLLAEKEIEDIARQCTSTQFIPLDIYVR
jgi:hypothetical protein